MAKIDHKNYTDYRALRELAIRYALSKGMDLGLVEDFAQDYCLACFLNQHNSLLFQMANFYRKCLGRSKGQKINPRSLALKTMKSLDKRYDPEDNIENSLEALEKKELIKSMLYELEILSKREKTIIIMHYFENISFLEISKKLDITPSRVSQLYMHALKILKLKLK